MNKPLFHVQRIGATILAEFKQLWDRYFGTIERFEGNAKQICEQIVERLWNGTFYRTGLGHFTFFFIRDFGTVAESLVRTGQKKHVLHTLKWALHHYRKAGVVTTCISVNGQPFNAPMHAIDSLPWLFHCLVVSNYDLNKAERAFLSKQLRMFQAEYLDTTGHVLPVTFAELRDAVVYDRSAYAVSLVGRLAWCVDKLELEGFPHTIEKYQTELITRYWNGEYFNADRTTDAFSAECALFPFFLGVIEDEVMAGATFDYIKTHRYDQPYPLVYTKQADAFTYRWWMTKPFMPDYCGETVWSWHGLFYLHSLRRFGRPEFEAERNRFGTDLIERHRTFPELTTIDGKWYKAPVYKSEAGMVWAALYVDLAQLEPVY